MDKTETYIKMCDCDEIQEGKPQDGVSGTWVGRDIILCTHGDWCGNYFYSVDTTKTRICDSCGNEEDYIGSIKTIWLPRQDQLQEMVSYIGGTWVVEQYFHNYLHSIYTHDRASENIDSMEQLWLAFVMKEKHNKTWNGQDWESKKV